MAHVLTLVLIICNTSWYGPENGAEIWIVSSLSSLKVDGKTNINSFNCIVPAYQKEDTLICHKPTANLNVCQVISTLSIPIANFDCHHRIMTRDLQKTLKSEQFPNMIIDFKTFSRLPSELQHNNIVMGKADIRLAGVVKTYTINFTANLNSHNKIELLGKREILFSEFGLKPPSKLGGTIKVKDQLEVEFKLLLHRIK